MRMLQIKAPWHNLWLMGTDTSSSLAAWEHLARLWKKTQCRYRASLQKHSLAAQQLLQHTEQWSFLSYVLSLGYFINAVLWSPLHNWAVMPILSRLGRSETRRMVPLLIFISELTTTMQCTHALFWRSTEVPGTEIHLGKKKKKATASNFPAAKNKTPKDLDCHLKLCYTHCTSSIIHPFSNSGHSLLNRVNLSFELF